MKTLTLSSNPTSLVRSSASLRTSSANVPLGATQKKARTEGMVVHSEEDDTTEPAPTTSSLDQLKAIEKLCLNDEVELVPGATTTTATEVPVEANTNSNVATAQVVPPEKEMATTTAQQRKEKKTDEEVCGGAPSQTPTTPSILAYATANAACNVDKILDEETECYRHAIVDVPALVELLTLVGRCPVCQSPLRTERIETNLTGVDDANSTRNVRTAKKTTTKNLSRVLPTVTISLRCSRGRCKFTRHWCSSPTTGISPLLRGVRQ